MFNQFFSTMSYDDIDNANLEQADESFSTMSYDDIDNANLEQADKSEAAHFVWQYFAVTNNIDARKGCTKNAVCMFSGCSISRADSIFLL